MGLLEPSMRGGGAGEKQLRKISSVLSARGLSWFWQSVCLRGEPGLGVPVRKAALGCALLHSGLDQQAAGGSSWFASVLIWGGHGAGPGTPTSWGAWARETLRAGGVGRSCVTLGSCSPSIYSSSPGEGTLADLGSQHGPPTLALSPTNSAQRLGQGWSSRKTDEVSLRIFRQSPSCISPANRLQCWRCHHQRVWHMI